MAAVAHCCIPLQLACTDAGPNQQLALVVFILPLTGAYAPLACGGDDRVKPALVVYTMHIIFII